VFIDILATFYELNLMQLMEMNQRNATQSRELKFYLEQFKGIHGDIHVPFKQIKVHPNLIWAYQEVIKHTLPKLTRLGPVEYTTEIQLALIETNKSA